MPAHVKSWYSVQAPQFPRMIPEAKIINTDVGGESRYMCASLKTVTQYQCIMQRPKVAAARAPTVPHVVIDLPWVI